VGRIAGSLSLVSLLMMASIAPAGTTDPCLTRANLPTEVETGAGAGPAAPRLPAIHTLSADTLDVLLADLHCSIPRYEDRLRALALARRGAPYALGTLGEASAEDPDPVFQVEDADCTVLVLTTVALANARSLEGAKAWMGPANYHRQGDTYPVTYRNRLHFTADRLSASPLFADITPEVARAEELESVRLVLNRQGSGEELLPIGWERELEIAFVPAAHLEAVLARVPSLCGIAFVRESNIARGLLVSHEGFLLDQRCLLHASSEAGEVVVVDLLDYLFRRDDPDNARSGRPRFDGALLYSLREGASDDLGRGPRPAGGVGGGAR
jgi:hypothetical protein